MNQRELVKIVSKKTGFTQEQVLLCLKEIICTITGALQSRENVFLRGFGSFLVKERKEKRLKMIRSGRMVEIPKKKIVKFYNHILSDDRI